MRLPPALNHAAGSRVYVNVKGERLAIGNWQLGNGDGIAPRHVKAASNSGDTILNYEFRN